MKYFYWGMATVFLAIVFIPLFAVNIPAQAGLWEKLSSLGDETVQAKSFSIEAKGWDLRGYVFQPPNMDKTCLFVAGSKKGGLTCW